MLQDVCVHLAELECLVVGLVGGVMEVRAQKPLAVSSLYMQHITVGKLLNCSFMWVEYYWCLSLEG